MRLANVRRALGRVPWALLLRRAVRLSIAAVLLGLILAGAAVAWVRSGTDRYTYSERDVPEAPVALVLGAQVYSDGEPSPFLQARLAIAQRLLETGKVQAILVSGDHREWKYDEPGAMTRWLVRRGVPENKIAQDHAGFDTYDSCVRALKIFGVRKTIIGQAGRLTAAPLRRALAWICRISAVAASSAAASCWCTDAGSWPSTK